jgi:hypothetical protein
LAGNPCMIHRFVQYRQSTTGPVLNPARISPIGTSPAPPTSTRLTGHAGSRPRRGGRDSWVGGPKDNPRQTENIPGIRMQLLRIFSGRNRHEPKNFWPGSGCSKKIPGLNTKKIIFFPAGFCREDLRECCHHPFPDGGCSEPTIAGARASGRRSRSCHCGGSELLLPSDPALHYKGSGWERL